MLKNSKPSVLSFMIKVILEPCEENQTMRRPEAKPKQKCPKLFMMTSSDRRMSDKRNPFN